ncbi:arginase-1-like [Uloborus diversus]|uniref:arginase-1-like n=1 Tax=Uloborus diversus TaxID=327109 RepID=UPI002408F44A|nr:arginase-1-like [Uloborus diversus]
MNFSSSMKKLLCNNYCLIKRVSFSTKPIGLIGAPISKGQKRSGVDQTPDVIRKAGLIKELKDFGLNIKDYGNVHFDENVVEPSGGKLRFPITVGAACKKVSDAVKNVISDERLCITLGGDHSVGIGTVHGHSQVHDLCVLWIDAHADINTVETTMSGNIHGMSCSFFLKDLELSSYGIPGFEWIKPCVQKKNIAYIGLRDVDPLEKQILRRENILHYTMRDVDELGIFEVTRRALKEINPDGSLSLHVSFDIDSIDKLVTPSTGTPVLGGLTAREALCFAEEISRIESLHAVDIVEVNPTLGSKEQIENTLLVTKMVIKAFLGCSRHGGIPKILKEFPNRV